jgi:hypothetical protein
MNLRVIPTSVHGVLDYLTGSALLATPELLRLKDVPFSALAFRSAGGGAAAYSLLTDYELGAKKISADARTSDARCRERRVARGVALGLWLCQERDTLLAAARPRGPLRNTRRQDDQDPAILL